MKQALRLALSVGASLGILALLLNMFTGGVSDEQRPSIFSTLQLTSLSLVAASLCIYLIGLLLRAHRYRFLIRIAGEKNVPSVRQMFLVTGVRNMVVDMLPARLGELGYVVLLNKGCGVKLQHCVSSLIIAIALDFVALLIVIFLIVIKQIIGVGSEGGLQGWLIGALIIAFVLSVSALSGLFFFVPVFNKWLNQRSVKPSSFISKAAVLLNDFSCSLATVRHSGQAMKLTMISFLIRCLKYFGLFLLFQAVVVPSFQVLAELPLEKVVSGLIGGEIGASLPIPTFMSFGAYEAGSTLIFQLIGVSQQATVVVTMLCVHIWSQLMEYSIGAFCVITFFWGAQSTKLVGPLPKSKTSTRGAVLVTYICAAFVFVSGSLTFVYQLWAASKLGSLSAPYAGQTSKDDDEWKELSKRHVANLDGFVVFSSNRDGNHDIFKLNLTDYQLVKLTSHPNTETYPRISSNGLKLVFSRAHQTWVSQRNSVAWDIHVLDLVTMQEHKIGSNGTAPHWVSASEITYLQEATKIVKVNIETLESSVLYQTGVGNDLPMNTAIHDPQYSPVRNQFVFTTKQNAIGLSNGYWGTVIASGDSHQGVHNGCELAWNYNSESLYQVEPGGRFNDVQISTVNPDTLESSLLIDLAAEFSHEYWPKDSSDGKYMVFGASRTAKEHEHDTADYEIFLWKVGTDSTKATRLTFHSGNDNRPDVFIEPP